MKVTLGDLLELEPRLIFEKKPSSSNKEIAARDRDVSWAVSARSTPPHLPQLRGGEIVLVPERVAAALGEELPALLREAAVRGASAVVTERASGALQLSTGGGEQSVMLEWADPLGGEAEMVINRLLTECRGDLYRIGSDLERCLTDVTLSGAGVETVIRVVAGATGLSLSVCGSDGRYLASAGAVNDTEHSDHSDKSIDRRLVGGAILRIDQTPAPLSIVTRQFADRIAAAANAAIQRDEALRPRGARRTEALAMLLRAEKMTGHERRSLALSVGLDPEGQFLVAVSHGVSERVVAQVLGAIGTPNPAGLERGSRTTVVGIDGGPGPSVVQRVSEAKRLWLLETSAAGDSLALSAPASGIANLPAAAAEARFVAGFQRLSAAPHMASFDSVADVGVLALLFALRESDALRRFVTEAIGALEAEDGRGVLRTTLRVFLESGGSQVDAAAKLGIHRNTLTYRLRRISAVTRRDVTNPASWLTLLLALRAADVLEVWLDVAARTRSEDRDSALDGGG